MELRYFNPYAETNQSKNRLPHWQQNSAVYFVTFRLADALPVERLRAWNEERSQWLAWHPEPWTLQIEREYHGRFSNSIEEMSDQSHGACPLKNPEAGNIVGDALSHFDGDRYHQIAWAVMPNHVHVLFIPHSSWTVAKLVHSWKSFTALALNKLHGRDGSVWQKDYFDRLVRDQRHFENVVRYIRNNPIKAHLQSGSYLHWESALARSI